MTLFDKLTEVAKAATEKATEIAKQVGDEASKAIDITKLQAKITTEKANISSVKKEIGERVYQNYKEQKELNLEDLIQKIVNSEETIAQLTAQIETIKADGKLEETTEETVFEKVEDTTEEKTEEVKAKKVCPLCGVEVDSDTTVCPVCGYEFN